MDSQIGSQVPYVSPQQVANNMSFHPISFALSSNLGTSNPYNQPKIKKFQYFSFGTAQTLSDSFVMGQSKMSI
jgi:hypothetical protein